ncbi:PIN domain-containing protein [Agromyces silvae]|uniref:PIN domain-containing protein n=1 Tax=Agromyces silvae TaxID=3388266 RepID=UPI00280AA2F4|nr:PIN domain-containing protein [Agromyces protaetiae]
MFIALLDTSVLWPSLQRDFLLSLAFEQIYRPIWSSAILDELEYHEARKLQNRYGLPSRLAEERAARLVGRMRSAFVDAEIAGWEPLEGTYGLPDPDDEHVVAAAQIAGAGVIVTSNLKDFPVARLPNGISAVPPHQFALDAVNISPERALVALTEIATRSGNSGPALSRQEVIQRLEARYGMSEAMLLVRQELAIGEPHSHT